MLPIYIQISTGLLMGYLTATLSESILHRYVTHATRQRKCRWASNPRLYCYLSRSHFRHAIVHHGWTFRSDHVTQFDNNNHRISVDSRALAAGDGKIKEIDYGLRAGWIGFVTYNLTTIPILPILAIVFGPWSAATATPLLAITPVLSRWFHPYLHCNHENAIREAPIWIAWLLQTTYFKAVARHHFLHHKHPNSNFNLLLGGDWLLGVHRSPTLADLEEMKGLGLRID